MGFAKMPIYEYECPECYRMEERWANDWEHYTKQPECLCGKTMVKKPSAPAIQFKGSGFYETDYKEKK